MVSHKARRVLRLNPSRLFVGKISPKRMRRCPARFGMAVFGQPLQFRDEVDLGQIEMGCGANLVLAPREVAVFAEDSMLLQLEVATS